MAADRVLRIMGLMAADGGGGSRRLCEVSAEVTGMSGAGIMLVDGSGPVGSLCSTDDTSRVIERLQYTLGEGPCIDAHNTGGEVVESDLAESGSRRWPAFTRSAVDAGARAVFGFPVRVGVARLGALNLYRDRPGPLSDDQRSDALIMADLAARIILATQSNVAPDGVAAGLDTEADLHLVVHQAAGMVSIQLDVSVAEALIRLRAYAFRSGRPINDVAAAVVKRELRFSEPPRPEDRP